MATASYSHHTELLNARVTRAVGADVRLLYGFSVPIVATVGFIIALAVSGQGWMVGAVGLFMLIALAVVVFGIVGMIDEPDNEQTH
jgi:hypothetical protein